MDDKMASSNNSKAFTLIELLVVIAIIAILASLLIPGLVRAKQKAQGIQCMNNHRQLSYAWIMYAHEHDDRFPYASAIDSTSYDPYTWMSGGLDYDPANPSNWDVTVDIQRSPLWTYCGLSAGIFRCPGDTSTIRPSSGPFRGQVVSRVRSMSVNSGSEGSAAFRHLQIKDLPRPDWIGINACPQL